MFTLTYTLCLYVCMYVCLNVFVHVHTWILSYWEYFVGFRIHTKVYITNQTFPVRQPEPISNTRCHFIASANRANLNLVSSCHLYGSLKLSLVWQESNYMLVLWRHLSLWKLNKKHIYMNVAVPLVYQVNEIPILDDVKVISRPRLFTLVIPQSNIVVCSKLRQPVKSSCCFIEQDTLPSLLSTGWFQEQIRAWIHNQTKINWEPYGRFT